MYAHFYQLTENPFNLTPDPKFHYINESTREAMAAILHGIHSRKGFVTLIGEAGTGKTTLLKRIVEEIEGETLVVFVFNPGVSFDELLEFICTELGVNADNRRRLTLLDKLNNFLLEQLTEGRNVVVMIDEAQTMDDSVLEELRLLSNLETSKEKILQILLSGQTELEEKLRRPNLRQLRQRIAVRATLRPMRSDEIGAYVETRMRGAGADRDDFFSVGALRKVWRASKGIPRVINVICDNAMMIAFADGKKRITGGVISEAIRDLQGTERREPLAARVRGWLQLPALRYPAAAAVALGVALPLVLAATRSSDLFDRAPRSEAVEGAPASASTAAAPVRDSAPAVRRTVVSAAPVREPVRAAREQAPATRPAQTQATHPATALRREPPASAPLAAREASKRPGSASASAPAPAAPAPAVVTTATAAARPARRSPAPPTPGRPADVSSRAKPAPSAPVDAANGDARAAEPDVVKDSIRRAEVMARSTAARLYDGKRDGLEASVAKQVADGSALSLESVPGGMIEAAAGAERMAAAMKSRTGTIDEETRRAAPGDSAPAAPARAVTTAAAPAPTAPRNEAAKGGDPEPQPATQLARRGRFLGPADAEPLIGRMVEVISGDTMWDIAVAHYGEAGPLTVKRILNSNPRIRDPRVLEVGAHIFLPFGRPSQMVRERPDGGFSVVVSVSPRESALVAVGEWLESVLGTVELETSEVGDGQPSFRLEAVGLGSRDEAIGLASEILAEYGKARRRASDAVGSG